MDTHITEELKELYKSYVGEFPETIESLPASGSHRKYFRLKGGKTLIGVYGESKEENQAFIYLAKHFSALRLPVPEVYDSTVNGYYYLQEDLGDKSLFDYISGKESAHISDVQLTTLLQDTMRHLADIQFRGAQGLDFQCCYPSAYMDRNSILWDLNYFKYCFLKTVPVEFDEQRLEDDFQSMADYLLKIPSETFMYRDFQSRNVMVRDGKPWFIDFQGGRRGPIHYDVASFLWQAKAQYSDELRETLLREYLASVAKYIPVQENVFREQLRHFVLFRTLQVLGVYGLRGNFEHKSHFLLSIPFAIKNLRQLLQMPYDECPYLCLVLQKLTELSQWNNEVQIHNGRQLVIDITSFAYKNGIPQDMSGNGGGFVFDCRAIHNPGRYVEFKQLTGMDAKVISYLDTLPEMASFLSHVYSLVDASVERYLQRGFTHLSVAFGCTGGQHRSVYAAQHMAEHLYHTFKEITVRLSHREQNFHQIFIPDRL